VLGSDGCDGGASDMMVMSGAPTMMVFATETELIPVRKRERCTVRGSKRKGQL
jgi:hypothetical protein